MSLKLLTKKYQETPPEKVKKLEKILAEMSQTMFFDNDGSNRRMSRIAKQILGHEKAQPPLGKKLFKVINSNREFLRSVDQSLIDVTVYRPNNIRLITEEVEKETSEESQEYVTFVRHRIRNYFAQDDYHDRFVYALCKNINLLNMDEIEKYLDAGFEHIIYSNMAQLALRRIDQFSYLFDDLSQFKNFTSPSYPQEFFTVLQYVDNSLAFLKETQNFEVAKMFSEEMIDDILVGGRYLRVGRSPFNLQKLRNKCLDYLESLPDPVGSLIELNYLDRQLDIYLENLGKIEKLIVAANVKGAVAQFLNEAEKAIDDLKKEKMRYDPFFILLGEDPPSYSYVKSLLEGMEGLVQTLQTKFSLSSSLRLPASKKDLQYPLTKYWSVLKRRSLDYLAAAIVLECLCHSYREFPAERIEGTELIDFLPLSRLFPFELPYYLADTDITEIPSRKTYERFASLFGLSPTILQKRHQEVIDVCRGRFAKEFRNKF